MLPPIAAGSRYKPTICEAQEDTIIFAESLADAQIKIENVYSLYQERNLPLVPKLIAIGTGISQIDGPFYVWHSDICYELNTAARATDALLKLSAVLGLPFSKISKLAWHFISSYAYVIHQRESYAAINRLKKFLVVHHIPLINQND